MSPSDFTPRPRRPWYRHLYMWVLMAVGLGVLVGYYFPTFGASLKPLSDGFIKLVKMMIAPIVFCTVVHGIASIGDVRRLGRVGMKTIIYFEVVSTLALVIGLVVVNVLKPGEGFTGVAAETSLDAVPDLAKKADALHAKDFLLGIIPTTLVSAFVDDQLLQVLLVAILVAFAVTRMGEHGLPVLRTIEHSTEILFGVMHIVMKLAPIGAFGAMGYTIGSFGIGSLGPLLKLMAGFYLTATFFVLVVLGTIAWLCGFSILRFLNYIKSELFLVLGTSSSEVALPGLIEKMERLGCAESTVGLVVPTGYSFNLDGTNIYMTMAAIFLTQATNHPMTLHQQLGLLVVAMITSKGASGVTGSGLITLAATMLTIPDFPMESLALLVGIDRFMSECRALTNLIGNGVATIVISRWEGELSTETLNKNLSEAIDLNGEIEAPAPHQLD